ncbi:MAG: class I SAM-dependent methyltransferase [Verrucomicrobiota bacterium]
MSDSLETIYKAENAALDRVLRRALGKSGLKLPVAKDGTLQILDLACGTCREAATLVKVFRELRGGGKPVRFVGADIRDRELDEAAARAKRAGQAGDTFEFLTENCAKIDRHAELGGEFDVTFLRHQNYWNDKPVWQRIFEQGLNKLKDDGLLVITSYFDREHELALRALDRAGAELVVTETNETSRLLSDAPGKSVDRHVAVFRRKK